MIFGYPKYKLFATNNVYLLELIGYFDSLHVEQLVMNETTRFHHYATLLELIRLYIAKDWSISIDHILQEGNSCADILAKMKTNNFDNLVTFNEHLHCLTCTLLDDALGVSFSNT